MEFSLTYNNSSAPISRQKAAVLGKYGQYRIGMCEQSYIFDESLVARECIVENASFENYESIFDLNVSASAMLYAESSKRTTFASPREL